MPCTVFMVHANQTLWVKVDVKIQMDHIWFLGVMVSTQDSESCDLSSKLGGT